MLRISPSSHVDIIGMFCGLVCGNSMLGMSILAEKGLYRASNMCSILWVVVWRVKSSVLTVCSGSNYSVSRGYYTKCSRSFDGSVMVNLHTCAKSLGVLAP